MPFYVIKGDLVNMNVDVIVNASNVKLKMVEGVGRAIFHKAGDRELSNACKAIGDCPVGQARITPSFNMTNTKSIIHAVAPIYVNGKHGEEKNLRSAYRATFKLMEDNNYHSIAFPLLSGEFSYPFKECYKIACDEILNYLKTHKNDIVYLVFFKNFPSTVDDGFQDKLTTYITSVYKPSFESLDNPVVTDNLTFVETVREYQKKTNTSDDDLILDGNLSSPLFEKLVTDKLYIPSKSVCLAFAIAMKLDEKHAISLLNSCGYRLIKSNLLDLIVSYYINEELFDVYKINNALFNYNIPLLGA